MVSILLNFFNKRFDKEKEFWGDLIYFLVYFHLLLKVYFHSVAILTCLNQDFKDLSGFIKLNRVDFENFIFLQNKLIFLVNLYLSIITIFL